jgi:hypothetical protein
VTIPHFQLLAIFPFFPESAPENKKVPIPHRDLDRHQACQIVNLGKINIRGHSKFFSAAIFHRRSFRER